MNNENKQLTNWIKDIESLAFKNEQEIITFPIKENNEPLISVRQIENIYFDDPNDDYLVREQVFNKIKNVLAKLSKQNLSLYFVDTYRSIQIQQIYWEKNFELTRKKYPDLKDEHEIKRITSIFTAPPQTAQHCTGGSIDVYLYDLQTNKIINDLDESKEENYTPLLYTSHPLIPKEQRFYRNLLCEVLQDEGFVNYPLEYWHFSYGNAEWAIYSNKQFAIYGPVKNLRLKSDLEEKNTMI